MTRRIEVYIPTNNTNNTTEAALQPPAELLGRAKAYEQTLREAGVPMEDVKRNLGGVIAAETTVVPVTLSRTADRLLQTAQNLGLPTSHFLQRAAEVSQEEGKVGGFGRGRSLVEGLKNQIQSARTRFSPRGGISPKKRKRK